ncbi:ribonuclease E/G [Tabrizicola sp. YIM 78059]|uniref:Rne/Rng family ribonuclease n=1 Tax=Tabrizicola sp. YIM 78059 TaxID=2529861 RepID=UPI0010AA4C9B|nr:ribonuclease E/G [Tabrizicola sp. YIM 78059]
MAKKMLIDATHPEETRVVVVDGNKVEEFDFETVNKRQITGNIYLAKVTRVEPSLQAAFVEYGGNRHGFLAFAEIHPDYYQIPVADRKALIEEERAMARAEEEEENRRSRRRPARPAPVTEAAKADDAVAEGPEGMAVVDLEDDDSDLIDAGETELVDATPSPDGEASAKAEGGENGEGEAPYRAVDHASETDDEIESIAEEDLAEEIAPPRRPRARRYKIQEVIKVRQIMLVQVVKEERGNKGAALTTYLSLAGRYCVLMPNTARGGGISRKITQAADRKRLKEIASEIEVPEGAGLIIRTAGAKRTKPEIKRDYEYLMRLWEQIRELTLKSIAPAKIYEEGDLIKRSIRDLYSREIDEVLVEGEAGYRTAKDFMRMIMPSHAKQVIRYNEPTPLFAKYQVEGYLAGMFNPVVQLKSGGYIVIGVTEALVAIDVNSGRATKEGSIEETALKTNLEAAEEIARQLRLRDLAGLIVIDFIDMEERKNNAAVEKRLKEKLKTDRARIQVGRISGFGLLEMSRQRLRPGMLESTTQPCPHCHGTGLIRSDDSMALTVLRALEEEGTRKRSREVLLKAPIGIVNYLINHKREHIALIEARYGMSVRIEADPMLVSPDYTIEKFKTATRVVPETPVVSGHAGLMGAPVDEQDHDIVEESAEEEQAVDAEAAEAQPQPAEGEGQPGKKKRRRRRRRRGGQREGSVAENGAAEGAGAEADDEESAEEPAETIEAAPPVAVEPEVEPTAPPEKPRRTRKPRGETAEASASADADSSEGPVTGTVSQESETSEPATAEKPAPKRRASRTRAEPKPETESAAETTAAKSKAPRSRTTRSKAAAEAPAAEATEAAAPTPEVVATEMPAAEAPAPEAATPDLPALAPDPGMEPAAEGMVADPGEARSASAEETAPAEEAAKPKRKGWWSLGR